MHQPPTVNETSGPNSAQTTSFAALRLALRRNVRVLLLSVALVVAATAAFTAWVTPVYESAATLQVRSGKDGGGLMGELGALVDLGLPGFDQDETGTEMGLLRSRRIAETVVDSLSLNVALEEPQLPRDRVLQVLRPSKDAPIGEYTLRRQPNGSFALQAAKLEQPAELPAHVNPTRPFRLGSLVLALAPSVTNSNVETIRFRVLPFARTIKQLRKDLLVERQEGGSKLIEISYRSPDPLLAAAVPNAVTRSFVRYKEGTSKTESRSTVAVLREQIASYEQQLRDAEERLRGFREQQRVIAPVEQATQEVKQLADLRAGREGLMIERKTLSSLLERVERAPRKSGVESPYRQIATYPAFIGNRAIQEILQALNELDTKRSELLALRTTADPDVRQLDQRIAELEQQLYRLASGYVTNLDTQIAASTEVVDKFDANIGSIPDRDVEFARLTRDRKILEEVYTVLQTRLKEAEIREAIDPGETRIVDAAPIPDEPVSPKPVVNLVLATVLGLMVGVAIALGREMADTRLRTRQDVEGMTAGIPLLGTVPVIQHGPNGNGRAIREWLPATRSRRVAPGATLVSHHPNSAAAEAYRALRTGLTLTDKGGAPQALVVTSPLPNEGKTTTAANLAITLAQQGGRVLLVDADLRRGELHELFSAEARPGLTEVLRQEAPLEAALQAWRGGPSTALALLPAGEQSTAPAELLGSAAMRALLDALRAQFDFVIFDAPPLNVVTDAAVLGSLADATILVARAGTTHRGSLNFAVSRLTHLRVPVAGLVLNHATDEHAAYEAYARHG